MSTADFLPGGTGGSGIVVVGGVGSGTDITDPLAAKRAAAIEYLGENYVKHPNYKFRERHAFSAVRWAPHSVLRPVQLAAQQAGRI